MRPRFQALALAFGVMGAVTAAHAQESPAGVLDEVTRGAFMAGRADLDHMEARGFLETGLRPVYPDGLDCLRIESFFADKTRGDGSRRVRRFFEGRHGGVDIPAPTGTPIIAIAAGKVVSKREGGNIGGLGIILQHAPADTGLDVWVYTEYKHLDKMPELELGVRVAKGDPIGVAGATGTAGPHYGPDGHSHLHLSVWYSKVPEFLDRRAFIPHHGYWMDPLVLFRGPPIDSAAVKALDSAAKRVVIPYRLPDGSFHPADSKVVWPFTCVPRK